MIPIGDMWQCALLYDYSALLCDHVVWIWLLFVNVKMNLH